LILAKPSLKAMASLRLSYFPNSDFPVITARHQLLLVARPPQFVDRRAVASMSGFVYDFEQSESGCRPNFNRLVHAARGKKLAIGTIHNVVDGKQMSWNGLV
jgi:hypothetical protein